MAGRLDLTTRDAGVEQRARKNPERRESGKQREEDKRKRQSGVG